MSNLDSLTRSAASSAARGMEPCPKVEVMVEVKSGSQRYMNSRTVMGVSPANFLSSVCKAAQGLVRGIGAQYKLGDGTTVEVTLRAA